MMKTEIEEKKPGEGMMKIITVNVPAAHVEAMEMLVGEDGIYPSRAAVIRAAVRELLMKELKRLKNAAKFTKKDEIITDEAEYVKVMNGKKDNIKEYKTYKIVRSLDITPTPPTKQKAPKKTRDPSRPNKGAGSIGNSFYPDFNHEEHFRGFYDK